MCVCVCVCVCVHMLCRLPLHSGQEDTPLPLVPLVPAPALVLLLPLVLRAPAAPHMQQKANPGLRPSAAPHAAHAVD